MDSDQECHRVSSLYLEYTNTLNGKIYCPVETVIVIFTLNYCDSNCFKIYLIKRNFEQSLTYVAANALAHFTPNYVEYDQIHDAVNQCTLPAVMTDDECLIWTGFGCVLRYIIKISSTINPEKKMLELLGHRSVCLQGCAETSVWTKFCEVELPHALQIVLASSLRNPCQVAIPEALVKLENHFHQPSIIMNINKRKRAILLSKNKTNDLGEKPDRNDVTTRCQQHAMVADMENNVAELQHNYAEGPDMTLTDLVIFPCITFIFDKWKPVLTTIRRYIPKIYDWYQRMCEKTDVLQISAAICLPDINDQPSVNCQSEDGCQIIMPSSKDELINIRLPNQKKFKAHRQTRCVDAVIARLKEHHIYAEEDKVVYTNPGLPWKSLDPMVHPIEGELPEKRVKRKCQQLENLVAAVKYVVKPGDKIVDFCSGAGHVGILLAYLLPDCKVILVENKENSINRAKVRVKKIGLTNITLYKCNLDYYKGSFDVGVCLHACGLATDLVMQSCLNKNASFVICPCCYGGIQNSHIVTYPRSKTFREVGITYEDYLMLGHAADQTNALSHLAKQGKDCMLIIDRDRAMVAQEYGYDVTLGSLQPLTCSPKNNLLIGKRIS